MKHTLIAALLAVCATGLVQAQPLNDEFSLQNGQMGFQNADGLIPLKAGAVVRVEKVQPTDCRMVRMFFPGPIDGRVDTRHYGNTLLEYPQIRGEARFHFNNNDGLHISLPDGPGFDYIRIRGGYEGKLYRDNDRLTDPGEQGKLLAEVKSQDFFFRQHFPERVTSRKVSFFQPEKTGLLSDVEFLRVSEVPAGADEAVGNVVVEDAEMDATLLPYAEAQYGPGQRMFVTPNPAVNEERGDRTLAGKTWRHISLPVEAERMGLGAVRLSFNAKQAGGAMTVRVHDPLDYRCELMAADFDLTGMDGNVTVELDFPDQMLPRDSRIWISIATSEDLTLEGGVMRVSLLQMMELKALPEAIAYRKQVLKGQYFGLSEPRPWTDLRKMNKESKYWPLLTELGDTLKAAYALAPEDSEILAYYTRVFLRPEGVQPKNNPVADVPGAPRWAVLGREAMTLGCSVPEWWLDHRMVEGTGEMGGNLDDDSDMYQNWLPFPMFDEDVLGQRLIRNAAALGDTIWTVNMENGMNRRTTDALHAYEAGPNQIAINGFWSGTDPIHFERCMALAAATEKMTVVRPSGRRYFKDRNLGAPMMEQDAPLGSATYYWPLFVHPLYEVARYNQHPRVITVMRELADAWISQCRPGSYPNKVDVTTEEVQNALTSNPGREHSQSQSWLAAYFVTGDEHFLSPFVMEMGVEAPKLDAERILADLSLTPPFAARSKELAEKIPPARERETGAEAHSLGDEYIRFAFTGDKALLEKGLQKVVNEYRNNYIMYTSVEPYPDRVFMANLWPVEMMYLGAHATRNKWTHEYAVSYSGLGRDFAALVYVNRPDALKLALFNFRDDVAAGAFRVQRLDHGIYKLRIGPDANDDGIMDTVAEERELELARLDQVPVNLPSRQLVIYELELVNRLDDVRLRSDLALSPREVTLAADGTLTARVHNLGIRPSEECRAAVRRGDVVVAETTIPAIEAPIDLVGRSVEIQLTGVQVGDELTVNDAAAIPEITRLNNSMIVR